MSILSLSVALQTQACAGTKVEMLRSPVKRSPRKESPGNWHTFVPSSEPGIRCPVNLVNLLTDPKLQKAYEEEMKRLGLDGIGDGTEGGDPSERDANGDTPLHRAVRSEMPLVFERVLMGELRKYGNDPKKILEILWQRNYSGSSVFMEAALASKATNPLKATNTDFFQRFFRCIASYLIARPEDDPITCLRCQVIGELLALRKCKKLSSDDFCAFMSILMGNTAREIGQPQLTYASVTKYPEVTGVLEKSTCNHTGVFEPQVQQRVQGSATEGTAVQTQVSAPSGSNRNVQNQKGPEEPSETTPGTFDEQLQEQWRKFQARRKNAKELSSKSYQGTNIREEKDSSGARVSVSETSESDSFTSEE